MSKADDLRAAREAQFKSSRGGKSAGDETITAPRVLTSTEPRSPERRSRAKLPAGVTTGPREANRKGRPRIEDRDKTATATKPWLKLGMSERTWYRRQAEKLTR